MLVIPRPVLSFILPHVSTSRTSLDLWPLGYCFVARNRWQSLGARYGLCAPSSTFLLLRNCLPCSFISHRPPHVISLSCLSQFNILFTRCRRWLNSPGRLVVTKRTAGFKMKCSLLFNRVHLCGLHDYHNKQSFFFLRCVVPVVLVQ